jgi:hypothetical protein
MGDEAHLSQCRCLASRRGFGSRCFHHDGIAAGILSNTHDGAFPLEWRAVRAIPWMQSTA